MTGRLFTPSDGPDSPQVAIVNQTLARRYFPTETAVGKRISADTGETWITIVGVVGDVRHYGLQREPTDEVYLPFARGAPIREGTFLVRTTADPAAMAAGLGGGARDRPNQPPQPTSRRSRRVRGESLAYPRLTTTLALRSPAGALHHRRRTGVEWWPSP